MFKGPRESEHTHPPNQEENAAEKLIAAVKRKARDHPEQPPAQLLRRELQGIESGVLSQLPAQPALVRTLQRLRRKELPGNPTKLSAFGEIPARYQNTLLGERFLLYDSGPEDISDEKSLSDEEEDEGNRPQH